MLRFQSNLDLGIILLVICRGENNTQHEVIGRLKGFRQSDEGEFMMIGRQEVFSPSIIKLEILKAKEK